MNIDPVVNDCDFIDNHASNVDSWHVHTLSDSDPAAVHTVSVRSLPPGIMQLGRVAVRRPATFYQCVQ